MYDDATMSHVHPSAEWVLQDDATWARDVGAAWQLAAAPGLAAVHKSPGALEKMIDDLSRSASDGPAAYWAPLLHLTTFGLGWRYPEVGLWRWLGSGMSDEHAVLAAIKDRYGPHVDLMATWLARLGGPSLRAKVFGDPYQRVPLPVKLQRAIDSVESRETYARMFGGGGDSLHLIPHLEHFNAPLSRTGVPVSGSSVVRRKVTLPLGGEKVDYVLVSDQYRSLFHALHNYAVPPETAGRSTRVGLICAPIGWLGNYRRSHETGLWFRGKHRWHSWGNAPEYPHETWGV